uniref:UBA domain-containing protein n=1 Tax=Syphacia muris TaxID=451379 RepID=A0A0N5AMU8_9BILA
MKMHITVSSDASGTFLVHLDVNEDMEMENFIALCQLEIPHYAEIPNKNFCISHNQRLIIMTSTSLKKTFKDLGICDGDAVVLTVLKNGTQGPSSSNSATVTGSDTNQVNSKLIADLVNAIKVPNASNVSSRFPGLKKREVDQLQLTFNMLKKDPRKRSAFRNFSPVLADCVERNDFDAFCNTYVSEREKEINRRRVMMDPTSAEGQRLIAEQIERENIDFSHQFAMEHMPEAYIPVTMLYIRMRINGVECKAFVDSGAQVSILSEATAKRCNLMRLVDKRFQATVHGVGGVKKMLGKIHTCLVQIEQHFFPCNFDVLSDHGIDILLGLDILRRHQCTIDLKNNVLKFSDSASTSFLSDAEIPHKELEAGEASATTGTVDSEKLASLVALGFEEEAARAMLIQCGNDLEMAASNLLSTANSTSNL